MYHLYMYLYSAPPTPCDPSTGFRLNNIMFYTRPSERTNGIFQFYRRYSLFNTHTIARNTTYIDHYCLRNVRGSMIIIQVYSINKTKKKTIIHGNQ